MSTERILGIDSGLNVTGYGIIEKKNSILQVVEAGIIRGGSAKRPLPDRLDELYTNITEIIRSLGPTTMALEELYSHYERPRTAIIMGHARGVICLAAGHCQIPIAHYAATKIKKVHTGNGRAPKHQMQIAVRNQLRLDEIPEPPDVADALAIAMCHHFAIHSPQLGL